METKRAYNIVNGIGGICATKQEADEALKTLEENTQNPTEQELDAQIEANRIAQGATCFITDMVAIAKQEGDKFRKEFNREPSEAEAKRIADSILIQAKTALVFVRGK